MANWAGMAKMPKSATGISTNNPQQSGFTLLEVMVTVMLIGIITTFAVLSLRGGSDTERLAREAKRLAALLTLSHQEAILSGEQHGVRFSETGYTFLNRVNQEWLLPANSSILTEYQLPKDLKLALWVEDRRIRLGDTAANLPQVLLLADGEATDFLVTFSVADSIRPGYSLSGNALGELRYGPIQ